MFFFKANDKKKKTMTHYYWADKWDLKLNCDFSDVKSMSICSLIFPEDVIITYYNYLFDT